MGSNKKYSPESFSWHQSAPVGDPRIAIQAGAQSHTHTRARSFYLRPPYSGLLLAELNQFSSPISFFSSCLISF